MSYNIEESSSSSASSDTGEGWGGVGEVMSDEEEQKVLCQALDSFQYVSPVSRSSLALYCSLHVSFQMSMDLTLWMLVTCFCTQCQEFHHSWFSKS